MLVHILNSLSKPYLLIYAFEAFSLYALALGRVCFAKLKTNLSTPPL